MCVVWTCWCSNILGNMATEVYRPPWIENGPVILLEDEHLGFYLEGLELHRETLSRGWPYPCIHSAYKKGSFCRGAWPRDNLHWTLIIAFDNNWINLWLVLKALEMSRWGEKMLVHFLLLQWNVEVHSLNEESPAWAHVFEHLTSSWWHCWENLWNSWEYNHMEDIHHWEWALGVTLGPAYDLSASCYCHYARPSLPLH